MEMIGAKRDPLSPRDKGEAPAQLEKMMPQMVNEGLFHSILKKIVVLFQTKKLKYVWVFGKVFERARGLSLPGEPQEIFSMLV
jgi:hypothetical protein